MPLIPSAWNELLKECAAYLNSKYQATDFILPKHGFISYAWYPDTLANRALQAWLQKLHDDLVTSGLEKVFLDIRKMDADMEKAMRENIEHSDAIFFICNEQFKKRFQEPKKTNLWFEVDHVLRTATARSNLQIFSLLKSDSKEKALLPELQDTPLLDFRDDVRYQKLLTGFRDIAGLLQQMHKIPATDPIYQQILYKHYVTHIPRIPKKFFGREAALDMLINRVAQNVVSIVTGTPGVGKSALVLNAVDRVRTLYSFVRYLNLQEQNWDSLLAQFASDLDTSPAQLGEVLGGITSWLILIDSCNASVPWMTTFPIGVLQQQRIILIQNEPVAEALVVPSLPHRFILDWLRSEVPEFRRNEESEFALVNYAVGRPRQVAQTITTLVTTPSLDLPSFFKYGYDSTLPQSIPVRRQAIISSAVSYKPHELHQDISKKWSIFKAQVKALFMARTTQLHSVILFHSDDASLATIIKTDLNDCRVEVALCDMYQEIPLCQALIIIATPSFKANCSAKVEWGIQAAAQKVKLLPIIMKGDFGTAVPSFLGKHLVRQVHCDGDLEQYSQAMAGLVNPLGVIPSLGEFAECADYARLWSRYRLSNVPPLTPTSFTTRAELTTLTSLAEQYTVVAITGMAGCGKSTLAWLYAEQQKQHFDFIRILNCDHGLETSLLSFAAEMSLKADLANLWVALGNKNYLLILDNLDTHESMALFPPLMLEKARIIITTRSELGWPQKIELKAFSAEETQQYLQKELPEDTKNNMELWRMSGGLPLALTAAITAIKQRHLEGGYTISDYLEEYHHKKAGVRHNPLQGSLALALPHLTQSPDAERLLDLCACLSTEPMPTIFFTHHQLLHSMPRVYNALQKLTEYSLVTVQERLLTMNALMQEAVQNRLERSDRLALLSALQSAIIDFYCTNREQFKARELQQLLAHIFRVIEQIQVLPSTYGLTEAKNCLWQQAADIHTRLGEYQAAEKIWLDVLSTKQIQHGVWHPEYATVLLSLAHVYSQTQDYAQALKLLEQAEKILKKSSDDSVAYANVLYHLSEHYSTLGNYDKQFEFLTTASAVIKQSTGADEQVEIIDEALQVARNNLGEIVKTPKIAQQYGYHIKLVPQDRLSLWRAIADQLKVLGIRPNGQNYTSTDRSYRNLPVPWVAIDQVDNIDLALQALVRALNRTIVIIPDHGGELIIRHASAETQAPIVLWQVTLSRRGVYYQSLHRDSSLTPERDLTLLLAPEKSHASTPTTLSAQSISTQIQELSPMRLLLQTATCRHMLALEDINFLRTLVIRYVEASYLAGKAEAPPGKPSVINRETTLANKVFDIPVDPGAIEADRTFLGLLSFKWVLNDRYDLFTASQTNPKTKLSPASFQRLRAYAQQITTTEEDLEYCLYSLMCSDLGKTAFFIQEHERIMGKKEDDHDRLLFNLLTHRRDLFPGLRLLSSQLQANYIEGFNTNFNLGQLVQGENLPVNLSLIQTSISDKSRKMRLGCELFEFASVLESKQGVLGGCPIMTEENYISYITAIEELMTPPLEQAYQRYIRRRGELVGIDATTPTGFAQGRIAALSRAFRHEEGRIIKTVWMELDKTTRDTLLEELTVTGLDTKPGILLYYAPALLANAVKATGDYPTGLQHGLRKLADIYRREREKDPIEAIVNVSADASEMLKLAKLTKQVPESPVWHQFLSKIAAYLARSPERPKRMLFRYFPFPDPDEQAALMAWIGRITKDLNQLGLEKLDDITKANIVFWVCNPHLKSAIATISPDDVQHKLVQELEVISHREPQPAIIALLQAGNIDTSIPEALQCYPVISLTEQRYQRRFTGFREAGLLPLLFHMQKDKGYEKILYEHYVQHLPYIPRLWGRATELDALGKQVHEHRLSVLAGEPGVGKTALALSFAQHVESDYLFVRYIHVRNRTDWHERLKELAQGLGVLVWELWSTLFALPKWLLIIDSGGIAAPWLIDLLPELLPEQRILLIQPQVMESIPTLKLMPLSYRAVLQMLRYHLPDSCLTDIERSIIMANGSPRKLTNVLARVASNRLGLREALEYEQAGAILHTDNLNPSEIAKGWAHVKEAVKLYLLQQRKTLTVGILATRDDMLLAQAISQDLIDCGWHVNILLIGQDISLTLQALIVIETQSFKMNYSLVAQQLSDIRSHGGIPLLSLGKSMTGLAVTYNVAIDSYYGSAYRHALLGRNSVIVSLSNLQNDLQYRRIWHDYWSSNMRQTSEAEDTRYQWCPDQIEVQEKVTATSGRTSRFSTLLTCFGIHSNRVAQAERSLPTPGANSESCPSCCVM